MVEKLDKKNDEVSVDTSESKKTVKSQNAQLVNFYATGRRKSRCRARVYVTKGTGQFVVNGKPVDNYFVREVERMIVRQPLSLLKVAEQVDIRVMVKGGGTTGQAGAVRHGVSRALVKYFVVEHAAIDVTYESLSNIVDDSTEEQEEGSSEAGGFVSNDDCMELSQTTKADHVRSITERLVKGEITVGELPAALIKSILKLQGPGWYRDDTRKKERKKVGLRGARAKEQYSKR